MLISYKFKNFCSFCNEAEFDLLAPGNKVKNRYPDNYIETEAGYDVLKTAVVIGENAGGKTNFINSISFLKSLFENNKSKHSYRALININNLPSACPAQCDTKQEFNIHMIGGSGAIYHYDLQIDEFSIVQEKLTYRCTKSGQEKLIVSAKRNEMKREEGKGSIAVSFELDTENCDKEVKRIIEQASFAKGDIGLFVSKLAILGDVHALEFVDWVNNKLIVESKNYNYYLYKNIQNEEDDLRIIKDSPEKRRNFIDKEISQLRPSYFEALRNYKDVLKQKNSLIKQLKANGSETKMRDMLEIYDKKKSSY